MATESLLADRPPHREAQLLTQAEREVLQWKAHGLTTRHIALIRDRSPHTVERHVHNALAKLGVRTVTHGVAICIRAGIIQ